MHLKILSRRVFQGFQRICHDDAKGSVEAEKIVFETLTRLFFHSKQVQITHGQLKFLFRRVCQGFRRTCHDAKESGEAEKTVFGT
jgi:hypothetical protein